jgi:hypothetical protein
MRNLILTIGAAAGAFALSDSGVAVAQPQAQVIQDQFIQAQFFDNAGSTPSSTLLFGRDVAGDAALEQAQFLWGGHNYCWYDGGWHGPGYYWCGYAYRRGFGWGGGEGWHGWSRGGGGRGGFHGGGHVGHVGGHVGWGHVGGGKAGGGFHGGGGHAGGGHAGGGDHHH